MGAHGRLLVITPTTRPTALVLNLATVRLDVGAAWALAGNVLTCQAGADGIYELSVDLTLENTAGTARTGVEFFAVINGVEEPDTSRDTYNRSLNVGRLGGSISGFARAFVAGDTIDLRAFRYFGLGPVAVRANGLTVLLKRIG